MTIGQIIHQTVDALPVTKQRQALSFVRKLQNGRSTPRRQTKRTAARHPPAYVPRDAAVRAIAGMWKDRTDLPKDPVEAVKVIRARMRSRGRNG